MLFFASADLNSKQDWQIPTLEVLDKMVEHVQHLPVDFSKTVIFAVQHHLETTASLYRSLLQIGIARIYSTGKYYSSSARVESAMQELGVYLTKNTRPTKPGNFYGAIRQDITYAWERMFTDIADSDINTILILDDGGRALELMPRSVALRYKVAGVEQTQAGLYSAALKLAPVSIVQVASSALKKHVEPPLIATAVINTITKLLDTTDFKPDTVFGVIGFGAIGKAITHHLLAKGFYVFIYDNNDGVLTSIEPSQYLYKEKSIISLINKVDYVFGCTGKDVTEKLSETLLNVIVHEVTLLSVSSEDKEFRELLQLMMHNLEFTGIELEPLGDIHFRTKAGGKIHVIAGGTPINFLMTTRFDQTWNVPAEDIAVTQGALFGGVIQAKLLADLGKNPLSMPMAPTKIMLSPHIQQHVIDVWKQTPRSNKDIEGLLDKFDDPTWIAQHSSGDYCCLPQLEETFLLASSLRARL